MLLIATFLVLIVFVLALGAAARRGDAGILERRRRARLDTAAKREDDAWYERLRRELDESPTVRRR